MNGDILQMAAEARRKEAHATLDQMRIKLQSSAAMMVYIDKSGEVVPIVCGAAHPPTVVYGAEVLKKLVMG